MLLLRVLPLPVLSLPVLPLPMLSLPVLPLPVLSLPVLPLPVLPLLLLFPCCRSPSWTLATRRQRRPWCLCQSWILSPPWIPFPTTVAFRDQTQMASFSRNRCRASQLRTTAPEVVVVVSFVLWFSLIGIRVLFEKVRVFNWENSFREIVVRVLLLFYSGVSDTCYEEELRLSENEQERAVGLRPSCCWTSPEAE
ncbi:uncharacterized protein HKW66_Vig0228550 [Vigna angularis]|uniref:Uncharacterized protein n=1 Tax=Phaseolus angularis TaxID=3914 RepID=A0A8T0K9Z1_PHAAN|nr:uncharacterized protein HKW66_Vig0228550 [Vigna angularis]